MAELTLQEFRDGGYLQEANRRFFHPLGLALSVETDDATGEVLRFGPIWDERGDLEGIRFAGEVHLAALAEKVETEWQLRRPHRHRALGYMVQPAEWKETPPA